MSTVEAHARLMSSISNSERWGMRVNTIVFQDDDGNLVENKKKSTTKGHVGAMFDRKGEYPDMPITTKDPTKQLGTSAGGDSAGAQRDRFRAQAKSHGYCRMPEVDDDGKVTYKMVRVTILLAEQLDPEGAFLDMFSAFLQEAETRGTDLTPLLRARRAGSDKIEKVQGKKKTQAAAK